LKDGIVHMAVLPTILGSQREMNMSSLVGGDGKERHPTKKPSG